MHPRILVLLLLLIAQGASTLCAQAPARLPWSHLPEPFDRYVQRRVTELSGTEWLDNVTAENWPAKHSAMRRELQGMLGLDPWPERTPLNPVLVGTVEGDGYIVEKLYFEPMPRLYIGVNLYRPKEVKEPLPAILYMCGHSNMTDGKVRFGNKTGYQHHGIWFARHGYVCLIPDTIQWGEIPGEHHGTHRLERWWWASRGYTPAGVEAWVGIRALDYLETRPEVDRTRFGMTGRSGGGIYTWWVGALDDRIKAAVPVAGITTLHDHVITGAIEGHCDCMFMVNTERWDFDRLAALMAPRPLLISNTDSDDIFPLAGVVEIFNRTRSLYRKLGKAEHVGLHIGEGPHKDTQPLHVGAFNWLNRFLKGGDRMDLIDEAARRRHEPAELKVFKAIPADERVTTVDEFFVPRFEEPDASPSAGEWPALRDRWMKALKEEAFRAWPANANPGAPVDKGGAVAEGVRLSVFEVATEEPFALPLWVLHREGLKPEEIKEVTLHVLDDAAWEKFRAWAAAGFPQQFKGASAEKEMFIQESESLLGSQRAAVYFCPRGTGLTSFATLPKAKRTHLLRRLLLLGESLESGQVWDIRQAAAALRLIPGLGKAPLTLSAENAMAANALYASLYIDNVASLDLDRLPASHRDGPTYLNVLRHLDLPQAAALAAERAPLMLHVEDPAPWRYAQEVSKALGLTQHRVQIRSRTQSPPTAP